MLLCPINSTLYLNSILSFIIMKRHCIQIEDYAVILQWEEQQKKGAFTGDAEFALFLLNIMNTRFDHKLLQPTLINKGIQCQITADEYSANLQEHVEEDGGRSASVPPEFEDDLSGSCYLSSPGSPDIGHLLDLEQLNSKIVSGTSHGLGPSDCYDTWSAAQLHETNAATGDIATRFESCEKILDDSRIIEMLSICKPMSIVVFDCKDYIPNFGDLFVAPTIKSEPASPASLNNTELEGDLYYNCWSNPVGMNTEAVTVDHLLVKKEDPEDNANEDFGTTDLVDLFEQAPAVKTKTGPRRKFKNLTCIVCGKIIPSKQALYSHIKRHNEKKFSCQVCSKMFSSKSDMTRHHLRVHVKIKYTCDVCSAGYSDKHSLNRHMLRHSINKERHWKCNMCGKAYFEKRTLVAHKKIHSDELPFKCDMCENAYKLKHYLKNHILAVHKGSYMCDLCGEFFERKRRLRHHKLEKHKPMQEYSSDSPFLCAECGKVIKMKRSYNSHMAKHWGKIKCELCGKCFAQNRGLKKHQAKKHANVFTQSVC